ncbi:MAG: nickel-responsive transcriptional regulator NikR [Candidatus Nitrosocaldaceae archaeon]
MKSNVVRISISLPENLLHNFDAVMKKIGYKDRSKAIQTAMIGFISENEWSNESSKGVGSIGLLYNPHSRNIEKSITLIQHNYNKIVTSTIHIHLDENNCLENIIVRGDVKSIKRLVKELSENKGIKSIKVNFVKVV